MEPVDASAGDEGKLLRRARAGDVEAYGRLVARHQAVAVRVAAAVGGADDAEDAAQDGFVKAYRALDRVDPERPFRPWLLAIVANEARSRRRSVARAARLVERAAALPPADLPSAEEEALARVGAGALGSALGRLREEEQTVLVLRLVLDLSEEDAAAVIGCAPGTVKSRTSRALARLRGLLEEAPA